MVLLSGGIDSSTCLYLARRRGDSVRAITVRIHGTASGEVRAARRIAERAGVVEHRLVSVPELMEVGDISGGPLSGGAVTPTYIPMKNAVFYSLAAAFADETGSQAIIGGHNRDDGEVFDDTSSRFFANLERAFRAGSPRLRRLKVQRPLRLRRKPEVIALAKRIGVPLELTWSCHREGNAHCWRCDGCRGRVSAFEAAGLEDPVRSKKV